MEMPKSQKPANPFQACSMGILSTRRRVSSHQPVPEYWQPNRDFHGQQLQDFGQNGSSICPAPYPSLWPGSHYWGSPPTKWRQKVPSERPWAWRGQGVVNLKELPLCSSSSLEPTPTMTFKRRLEKGEEEPCNKHLVTEDMMADRFNHLSLENDHAYSDNGFLPQALRDWKCQTDQRVPPASSGVSGERREENVVVEREFCMGEAPVLVLSTVLQESLREPGLKSILPEQVQYSMSHPCMELVLWKPPGSLIQEAISSLRKQQQSSPKSSSHGATLSPLFLQLNTDHSGASPWRGVLQHDLEDRMEL